MTNIIESVGQPPDATIKSLPSTNKLQLQLLSQVERIGKSLGADVVTAFVYDAKAARFCCPAGYGLYDPETFYDPRLAPRSGRVAGTIAREKRPFISEVVPGRSPMEGPFSIRESICSAAGFPLVFDDQTLGVLFVSYRRPHQFSKDEQQLIGDETQNLAKLIFECPIIDVLKERSQIEAPSRKVVSVLQAMLSLACDATNQAVAIWQLQPEDNSHVLLVGTGLTHQYFQLGNKGVTDGWLHEISRTGEPAQIDVLSDPRFPFPEVALKAGWKSAIGLPIRVNNRVIGIVEGLAYEQELDGADRDVLLRLSELVSVTLENEHLHAQTRDIAEIVHTLRVAADFGAATQVIVDGAQKLTRATHGALYRVDEPSGFTLLYPARHAIPSPFADAIDAASNGHIDRSQESAFLDIPIELDEDSTHLCVYDAGGSPFNLEHERLLQSLADQASVVLRWPRLLLNASTEIERKSTRLFAQDTEFARFVGNVRRFQGMDFDFAALQVIEGNNIETVASFAADWRGRSKHYLEENPILRDVQADIVLASPPRAEVIWGDDPRFDRWIYKTFQGPDYVRVIVPIFLVKDKEGRTLSEAEIRSWIHSWTTQRPAPTSRAGYRREIAKFEIPDDEKTWKIIGTIEAGYVDSKRMTISVEDAIALTSEAACLALGFHDTFLESVLQSVVDHAARIVGAKYASLHFDRAADGRYTYEVFSGSVGSTLSKIPPRINGLGDRAIQAGRTLCIPDPRKSHDRLQLKYENRPVFDQGINAMAAIPLLVRDTADSNFRADEQFDDQSDDQSDDHGKGVVYVGFGDDDDHVHHFTEDEIGWLQVFANSAAHAIRHAASYTQMRNQARLLSNLHSVAQSLVSFPEDPDIIDHIAWTVLNILGADVVTIYEYVQEEDRFEAPPTIAGRLIDLDAMRTQVRAADSTCLLVKGNLKPIYASQSHGHKLLDPQRTGAQPSFVERERVISSAAIPLITDDDGTQDVVGILFVNYRRRCHFNRSHRQLIETLASTAAIAIKNGRLLDVFRTADHGTIVGECLDEVLNRILGQLVRYTHCERAQIRLHDMLRSKLVTRCKIENAGAQAESSATLEVREAVELRALQSGEYQKTDDYTKLKPSAAGSSVTVPLNRDGQTLGVLTVSCAQARAFRGRQVSVLQGLANRAVLALMSDESKNRISTSEKLATLAGLTGTLLHRLKNDLLGISHAANKLRRASEAGNTEETIRVVEQITELKQSFLAQVGRLRDWSNHEYGKVDVSAALNKAITMAKVPESVQLIQSPHPNLPAISGDQALLSEVFNILIRNAVEAVDDSGVISVDVSVEESAGRKWIIVRVSDNGCGIDDETLKNLFKPKHSAKTNGLGIGLWLANSYVGLLGGKLEPENRPQGGTIFTAGLPVEEVI